MPACLRLQLCLRKCVHWPGILEAGLHCLYTGFFVIEAATYGLILEQKFHGVLQIVLINFYLVLLCLVFIRWNLDMNSVVCQLLISLLSFTLTILVGKLILMYIDFMEKPRDPWKRQGYVTPVSNNHTIAENGSGEQEMERGPRKVSADIMKLDPLIVILDISVYLLISVSYIFMLLKISIKLRNNSKTLFPDPSRSHPATVSSQASFYGINLSESSIISGSLTMT